jgi:hypothetical protein
LKGAALIALVLAVAACDVGNPQPSPSPPASPVPNPAGTLAGDLRTHLDLLLGEQVMIVAKQTVAAANHTDDYAAYTRLLATNTAELSELWRRAFGNTTATRLADSWDTQNAYLIDYTIGVVTHDPARAKTASTNLTQKFVPEFSALVAGASRLPLDPVTLLLGQQALENKAFIDDYGAPKLAQFYSDVHRAYAQTARFGDALAVEIADRFPDKFPGDAELRAVNARVTTNTLLQERSYLETMATAAQVAGRNAEAGFASTAVATNAAATATAFATTLGQDPAMLKAALDAEMLALTNYTAAKGARDALLKNAGEVASLAHVSGQHAVDHVNALIKVVDDQRAKSFSALADDDRSAATSTQPMGDAVRG